MHTTKNAICYISLNLSYVIRVFLSVCEWTSGEFINLFVKNYHAIAWFYERYKIKHSRQITFQNNFCESNLDSIFTNLFLRVLKTNVIDKIIIFVPCENISLWKKKTNMKSLPEQILYIQMEQKFYSSNYLE